MTKNKKLLISTERTTVADLKREMQKPRLTESVRNDGRDLAAPVTEEPR
jgi:hypothetical protein